METAWVNNEIIEVNAWSKYIQYIGVRHERLDHQVIGRGTDMGETHKQDSVTRQSNSRPGKKGREPGPMSRSSKLGPDQGIHDRSGKHTRKTLDDQAIELKAWQKVHIVGRQKQADTNM